MNDLNRNRLHTRDLAWIALTAAVISVCSWVTVPIGAVPVTLQTFGVSFALFFLGGRKGTLSVLIYLILGAVGLPVFSGFGSGVGVLFGLTGGYLFGFLLMGGWFWLTERLFRQKNAGILSYLQMIPGLFLCYGYGTVQFMLVNGRYGFWQVLMICVIPFILPDLVKLYLGWICSGLVKKAIFRNE